VKLAPKFLGTIGGDDVDLLGRDRLELERAVGQARIVEVRSAPKLREFKRGELEPGRFGTLVAADGSHYRRFNGVGFDRGQLIEHLPESVCAFIVRGDLDPPEVVLLERAGA
jgi:hypothetical protein